MNPIHQSELENIVLELQTFVGAQLQEVLQTDQGIGLGFYQRQKVDWLWFDFDSSRPLILHLSGAPPKKHKIVKPLTLFLRAHFVGRKLLSARAPREMGRVLLLEYSGGSVNEIFRMEARLFPKGTNFILQAGEKKLSLRKIEALPLSDFVRADPEQIRTWAEIRAEWDLQNSNTATPSQSVGTPIVAAKTPHNVALEKKRRALEKISQDIATKRNPVWRELGEWLKTHSSLDVPQAWLEKIDSRKSLAWNIENCFTKAKDNERKLSGSVHRLEQVQAEIKKLESQSLEKRTEKQMPVAKTGKGLMQKAHATGRKKILENGLEAYIGKSAKDNLALLRQAQSFDYWLHLQDYPGAHAIVRRTRTQVIRDEDFQILGQWVAQESLKKNSAELKGQKFILLIVETRFVTPIKGDRLGRVTFKNERRLTVHF